ncbi:hypothetical protein IscW_ISCW011058 [Ixodes scapularis]|uniref:Actin-related protein 8 n=1 Tax=Ixodes scapularis TaxID=6945 RepID=B7Q8L6_IXOSC|nr:hypothetical protein IscW_ISCW011058 [Ixodes scapularis]|eukprot:XP_002412373.1 hypothetical protein IscW_ISCW011058 [Ixodes scapularis]
MPRVTRTGPPMQPIQATAIVVIHPGSMFLRIGRASDSHPHTLPHVVARPCLSATQQPHVDPILVPEVNMVRARFLFAPSAGAGVPNVSARRTPAFHR